MEVTCIRCGLIDDYEVRQSGPHKTAYCNGCGKYIKHLPQENSNLKLYFGKYKDREITSLTGKEEVDYLKWVLERHTTLSDKYRIVISKHLGL